MDTNHMEYLQSASAICFVIAAAALVLALGLFFFFDIQNVFLIEIGHAKSRAVQEMEARNLQAEKQRANAGERIGGSGERREDSVIQGDGTGERREFLGKTRDDSGERRELSEKARDDSGERRDDSESSRRNTVRLDDTP